LHHFTKYVNEHKQLPDIIDSTEQFTLYKDGPDDMPVLMILEPYVNDGNMNYVEGYNHGWQYGWADEIEIERLSDVAYRVCNPSFHVRNKAEHYKNIMGDRTAVMYRGNDKALEITRTPYTAMEEMARDSGSDKFLVQTDEEEFYQYFKERFPDTICFEDIPRINKNPDSYVMPKKGHKTNFAVNFNAALMAIASAPIMIINSGNTGHWASIYRGKKEGIYQWHGNEGKWKKF
jgi:hypothetical protein